jgi:hypothetical protein
VIITLGEATVTLVAAGIGVVGALSGVVVGVVLERVLRYWGGLWCEPAHYEVVPRFGNDWEGVEAATELEAAEWIDYSVRLDLYNSREVSVGLRNIRLVFECLHGKRSVVPNDKATEPRRSIGTSGVPEPQMYGPLHVLNLPPRQLVVKELTGRLDDPEDVRLVFEWQQLEFACERRRVWPLPPKKLRWVVASRPPDHL